MSHAAPAPDLGPSIRELQSLGANLCIVTPAGEKISLGDRPDSARVSVHTQGALRAIGRRDHLALAEAYLRGEIDIEGDWSEVMRWTEVVAVTASWPIQTEMPSRH